MNYNIAQRKVDESKSHRLHPKSDGVLFTQNDNVLFALYLP